MSPTELLEKPEEILLKCVIVVQAQLPSSGNGVERNRDPWSFAWIASPRHRGTGRDRWVRCLLASQGRWQRFMIWSV
jgi:hypothetical protein